MSVGEIIDIDRWILQFESSLGVTEYDPPDVNACGILLAAFTIRFIPLSNLPFRYRLILSRDRRRLIGIELWVGPKLQIVTACLGICQGRH